MLDPSPMPPLRDELHMKIALCRPRNLPHLIEMIGGQELVCLGRLRDLKSVTEEVPGPAHDWSRLMGVLASEAEIAFWNARIEWLQSARELLEQLRDEHESSRPGAITDTRAGQVDRLRRI
jgi:hypothetical protein